MPALFAATLFVSAFLLFMVEPMVGKMILPLLGGSPAAWNTCMVFFQGLLLLGTVYAHNVTTRYAPGRQAALHLTVLLATIGYLGVAAVLSPKGTPVPVFQSLAPQGEAYPMFGVLALLGVAIGLPFLVVSTSAPLLQKWFNYTGHPSARDPYFLYAASNAGSLLSLLAYPLFIEPSLTLAEQAWAFAGGFVLLTAMAFLCGRAAGSPLRPAPVVRKAAAGVAGPDPFAPTAGRQARWVGLAFVPSSLMLGVTFYMTTDIASVPLLWVIPLALYLITFIIAFARTPAWFRPLLANLSPVLTLLLVFVLISNATAKLSTFLTLALHLVVYFFTALLMHNELVHDRPDPKYLTRYFLWMSVGGALGGVFNALVAPVAFPQAYEYPIAIAVGCFLIPPLTDTIREEAGAGPSARGGLSVLLDLLVPVAMAALVGGLTLLPEKTTWFSPGCDTVADWLTRTANAVGLRVAVGPEPLVLLALFALPCVLCFFCIDRPVRFGLCVTVILAVNYYRAARTEAVVLGARSFFGILKVEQDRDVRPVFYFETKEPGSDEKEKIWAIQKYGFYKLMHGTTLHGMQGTGTPLRPMADDVPVLGAWSPWEVLAVAGAEKAYDFRQEPLTYYHRTGPVGAIFNRARTIDRLADVAMVGLGTGSAAAYALPGQKLTFYEIDPTVIDLVVKPRVMNPDEVKKGEPALMGPFTYVDDAKKRGAAVDFVLGDARLKLQETADARYGLLLVDAFSSDSIPVHLLTREAIELYKTRLKDHGLLALHISNRYIMLEPVVDRLAAETGLVARVFSDSKEDKYPGKTASSWVVLAKSEADLGDEILGDAADLRYGAVAGALGWEVFDNPHWPLFTFPWKKLSGGDEVPAWTDDYSDVLRVMRLKEIRSVRKFFGLPVPFDTGD